MSYEARKCPSCSSIEYTVLDEELGVYKCKHCDTVFERAAVCKPPSRGLLTKLADVVESLDTSSVDSSDNDKARELTDSEKAELAKLQESAEEKRRELSRLDTRYLLPAIVLAVCGSLLVIGVMLLFVDKLPLGDIAAAVVGGLLLAGFVVSAARMTAVAIIQSKLRAELHRITAAAEAIESAQITD